MKKVNLLKHLMLLVVGVAFAFNASAESGKWVLQLWDHTGQICGTYDLTIQPNVTFTDDQVVVTTDVADVFYYSLPNMWKFTYQWTPGSGLNNIAADNTMMKYDGSSIVFPALEAGSKISVYAANGMLVMDKTVGTAGEYAFPLNSLSQGVYMVNVNGKTYKIVKK